MAANSSAPCGAQHAALDGTRRRNNQLSSRPANGPFGTFAKTRKAHLRRSSRHSQSTAVPSTESGTVAGLDTASCRT
eukprot:10458039-Alexandrium_andersonii.AAC.1